MTVHWRGLTPTALRWSTLSPCRKEGNSRKNNYFSSSTLFAACRREGGRAQQWPGELTM
jgi:hypothetical protein